MRLLLLLAGASACGNDAPVAPRLPERLVTCLPPVTVTVEPATPPRIRWSPACGATYLEVASPDYQQVFWIIQGDTGKIAPGVRYGINPPDYVSRFGPHDLRPGDWYAVRLGVMIDENSYAVVGEGLFRR